MAFFQKLFRLLGRGGPKVQLTLFDQSVSRDGKVRGVLRVEGGKEACTLTDVEGWIYQHEPARIENQQMVTPVRYIGNVKQPLGENIALSPGRQVDLPFEIPLRREDVLASTSKIKHVVEVGVHLTDMLPRKAKAPVQVTD